MTAINDTNRDLDMPSDTGETDNNHEISSLDIACRMGLVSHISACATNVNQNKCALPKTVRNWMIYSDIIFYSTSKSTWLASGERLIINKHRTDMTISLSDNLHGLQDAQFMKEIDSFSCNEVVASHKLIIPESPGMINILLSTQWSVSNVYHLIFDSLAKLSIVERVYPRSSINILAPEGGILPDILETLGYSYGLYKRNQFIKGKIGIVSMPHFTGNIPIDSRLYLAGSASHIAPSPCASVYISREQGRHRSILNEEDLLEGLSAIMSLNIVRLELLSIPDQISLLKGAELVVAPHGAGLSWIAFNSRPCHLFEIFSSDYVNNCFDGVCANGSLHERYVEPNTSQSSGFVVDVKRLVQSFADFVERAAKC